MLSTNPAYKVVYDNHDIKLYQPIEVDGYHVSRYVAAGSQNIYSASGATKHYLEAMANAIKQMCEDGGKQQIRTDIGTLMNNMLYRIKFPVDEECAIRMGAIYCLLEDENPEIVSPIVTEEKTKLARQYPDLYAFFLTLGIEYTQSWTHIDRASLTADYFLERRKQLEMLTPYSPSSQL